MGTSQSSKGPNGKSPLLPPWADDEPHKSCPTPEKRRYKYFRTALGKAVSSGNELDFKKALSHYAQTSSGGGLTAARRFGSATTAGSQLFVFLKNGINESISLYNLNGLSCDKAISKITTFLQTDDGDSEKIRNAMNEALAEALEGIEEFDSNKITGDVIIDTMISYLSNIVFEQIVMDSNKSFNKAKTPEQAIQAENTLYELIRVVVDEKMFSYFSQGIDMLDSKEMKTIQKQVIIDVWKEWEVN